MNTKAIPGPQGQGTQRTGDLPIGGDFGNVLSPGTTGANAAGIGNFPQPSPRAVNPQGQGDSQDGYVPAAPPAPSGDAVEQYFDPGEANHAGGPNPDNVPEQAYAKPTGANNPSALGPGMR